MVEPTSLKVALTTSRVQAIVTAEEAVEVKEILFPSEEDIILPRRGWCRPCGGVVSGDISASKPLWEDLDMI